MKFRDDMSLNLLMFFQTFDPLVDNLNLWKNKLQKPVEFLGDLKLDFQDYNKLKTIRRYDSNIPGINQSFQTRECIQQWSELQDSQHILTSTPLVLIGLRLQVYRAEGTTQWFTAVVTGYNEGTSEFTVTDDTVLEEHYEDPRLTQMSILGDGSKTICNQTYFLVCNKKKPVWLCRRIKSRRRHIQTFDLNNN